MDCSTPGFPVHHQPPELAQIHVHQVSDTIQPSHPLSSPCPPAFNLSQNQGLFQWVSSSYQVARYWHFIFNISPSNEYSGLASFRIDQFDLLAVQGTLESSSTPQFKSINSSVLRGGHFYSANHTIRLSQSQCLQAKGPPLSSWTCVHTKGHLPSFPPPTDWEERWGQCFPNLISLTFSYDSWSAN